MQHRCGEDAHGRSHRHKHGILGTRYDDRGAMCSETHGASEPGTGGANNSVRVGARRGQVPLDNDKSFLCGVLCSAQAVIPLLTPDEVCEPKQSAY